MDCLKPLAPLDSYAEPSHPFWLWGGKSSQFGKVIEQWPRNGKAGQRQRVCFQTCFGALKNSSMYRIVPSIIQTNGTVPPLVDLMISCINCQVEQLETVNKLQMPWSKQSMPWIGGTSPIFGWGNKYFFDSNYPICFHEITEYHISPRISFFQVSSPFLVLKPSFFAGQRCHFLTNPPSFDLSFVPGGTETPCRRWSPHPRHAGAIEYLSFIPPPLFFWWKWGGVPLESLFWDFFGQFMYHCL